MPDNDDIPRRRRVLVLDIPQAAVREGRDALVRWAGLLEELLP